MFFWLESGCVVYMLRGQVLRRAYGKRVQVFWIPVKLLRGIDRDIYTLYNLLDFYMWLIPMVEWSPGFSIILLTSHNDTSTIPIHFYQPPLPILHSHCLETLHRIPSSTGRVRSHCRASHSPVVTLGSGCDSNSSNSSYPRVVILSSVVLYTGNGSLVLEEEPLDRFPPPDESLPLCWKPRILAERSPLWAGEEEEEVE